MWRFLLDLWECWDESYRVEPGWELHTFFSLWTLSLLALFCLSLHEWRQETGECLHWKRWKYLSLALIGFLIFRERIEDVGRAGTSYFRQRQGSSRAWVVTFTVLIRLWQLWQGALTDGSYETSLRLKAGILAPFLLHILPLFWSLRAVRCFC